MKKKKWKKLCHEREEEITHWWACYHGARKAYCQYRDESKELADAAEFEARVAAKLATVPLLGCNSNCPWNKMDPQNSFGCIHEYERRFCRLRNARITVEEEMD